MADLTVLGRVLKTTAPETVFRQLQPFYRGALVLVAISGMMLVAAGPYKYYTNPLFPLKLGLLVVAVTLHAILQPPPEHSKRGAQARDCVAGRLDFGGDCRPLARPHR